MKNENKTEQDEHIVTVCRIRLAQRILVAACDVTPDLVMDVSWQKAMVHTTALLSKVQHPARDQNDIEELSRAVEGPTDEETLHRLEKKKAA